MGKLLEYKVFKGVFTINTDTIADHSAFPAQKVNQRLQEILYCGSPEFDRILNYLAENSGKMLRPRMVYLSGAMYPQDENLLINIAVAVELIHLASLVHDDIIDNAELRRGKPSLNQRWGNQVSVLTGDYLFAAAFNLISQSNSIPVMENLTDTIKVMCSGEIKQLGLLFNLNLTEEDYFDKTYRKTACLFASSCAVGAILGKAPEKQIRMLEQFGLYLGYAYQIIDDVLDFVSDSELLGKPVASDLSQGNITLPVILALKNHRQGEKLRNILQNSVSQPSQLNQVQEILEESGALEESVYLSRQYLELGLNLLEEFPQTAVIEEMKSLSRYLLEGYYEKLSPELSTIPPLALSPQTYDIPPVV